MSALSTTASHSFSRRIFNNQNQALIIPQSTLDKIHIEKHPNTVIVYMKYCFCFSD